MEEGLLGPDLLIIALASRPILLGAASIAFLPLLAVQPTLFMLLFAISSLFKRSQTLDFPLGDPFQLLGLLKNLQI